MSSINIDNFCIRHFFARNTAPSVSDKTPLFLLESPHKRAWGSGE